MNGIEKITGRIDEDVQKEIDALNAEARAKADAITRDYEAKAKAESEAILKKGEQNAALRGERLGSVAQLESRKLTLAAKQEMVERAFQQALADLVGLPDEEYVSLLAALAAQASRTGREQVILSQKDRTRLGKQIVSAANEILAKKVAPKLPGELTDSKYGAILDKVVTGASAVLNGTGMLTLAEESRPMAGGLILKDDKVETNCSFEVLIHLQRDALAAEVAQTLFG